MLTQVCQYTFEN